LAALYMLDIANGPSLAEKKSKKLFWVKLSGNLGLVYFGTQKWYFVTQKIVNEFFTSEIMQRILHFANNLIPNFIYKNIFLKIKQ
jgi:hypothetical protein